MFKPFSRRDFLTLAFLLAASAAGVWKVAQHAGPVGFVVEPALSHAKPSPAQPGQVQSPGGNFRFDAQFVSAAPGQAVHVASMVELVNGDLRAVCFQARVREPRT